MRRVNAGKNAVRMASPGLPNSSLPSTGSVEIAAETVTILSRRVMVAGDLIASDSRARVGHAHTIGRRYARCG